MLSTEAEQQMFNRVWHRAKTKKKSIIGSVCMYRCSNGLPCFAGALISDELYREFMEGTHASGDAVLSAIMETMNAVPTKNTSEMILDMQCVHDYCKPEEWVGELRKLAIKYGFSMRAAKKYSKERGV